jgi:hypothetical protein
MKNEKKMCGSTLKVYSILILNILISYPSLANNRPIHYNIIKVNNIKLVPDDKRKKKNKGNILSLRKENVTR